MYWLERPNTVKLITGIVQVHDSLFGANGGLKRDLLNLVGIERHLKKLKLSRYAPENKHSNIHVTFKPSPSIRLEP
jgi:hypothetical protein